MTSHKTNAVRILDTLGISYELRPYAVDPDDLTAPTVARKIGLPVEQVFKTLVTVAQTGEHLFAVVPGNAELDLKKLATAAGVKRAEVASLRDVEPLTGYVRGGVTIMGARKPFRPFANETLELHDRISVSAGMRGLQIVLAPTAYLLASGCTVADLTKVPH